MDIRRKASVKKKKVVKQKTDVKRGGLQEGRRQKESGRLKEDVQKMANLTEWVDVKKK